MSKYARSGRLGHVAQHLGNCPLPSRPGLQFDDDDPRPCVTRRDVDEARGDRTFRSIVDDFQARLELPNRATQGSLQITFQADERATIVSRFVHALAFRCIDPGTGVIVLRFAPELAVSLDRVPVRGQIVPDVAVEWDIGRVRSIPSLITRRIFQFAYHPLKLVPVVVLVQISVALLHPPGTMHLRLNGPGRVVLLFEPALVGRFHLFSVAGSDRTVSRHGCG